MSNRSKLKSLALALGGGCLVYSVFSCLMTVGVMVWLAVSVHSCVEKRAEDEAYLNRFTESALPETLNLWDELVLEKKFATEYTPIDSEYDTIILRNSKIKGMFSSPDDEIVASVDGKVITEDYHDNITYNYRGYTLGENVNYFAYDDVKTVYFISPDGEELKTEPKEELLKLHTESSDTTENAEPEYGIVRKSDYDESIYGIENSDGEILVECRFTHAHAVTDEIFFLSDDEGNWLYNAENNSFLDASDMEDFLAVGDCFAAVTYSDRGEKVYTIYN